MFQIDSDLEYHDILVLKPPHETARYFLLVLFFYLVHVSLPVRVWPTLTFEIGTALKQILVESIFFAYNFNNTEQI